MFRTFTLFFILFLIPYSLFAKEGFIVESIGTNKSIEYRKKLVEQVLSSDLMYFGYSALSIILDGQLFEPRGLMNGKLIRLSPNVSKESEFLKLLVHEVAHYIDIYRIISFGKNTDPSAYFYDISWSARTTKKAGETIMSFVSGYAATNQYEDFAESFVFYVFHNEEFADRALRNESLRKKYLFFQEYVFTDGVFIGTDFGIGRVPTYLWDTTKIPVSVRKYLYFLQ